jgi:hypothetical protein
MDATLQDHIKLSEEVYSFILEENRLLKKTGKAPDQSVLDAKRVILSRLDESLARLRAAAMPASPRTRSQRELMEKAQQMVLKTLLLDRENEQLLLKTTLPASRQTAPLRPSATHVQRLYGKY